MRLNTVSLKVVLLSNQCLEQIKSGSHHIFRQQSLDNDLVLPPVCIFCFAFFKKKVKLAVWKEHWIEVREHSSALCFLVPSGSSCFSPLVSLPLKCSL